ncbi:putative sinapine esterase [Helianthus debilis subsp. tardiflorus]
MASSSSSFSVTFGMILVWLIMSCFLYANGCYTSIISFGDSLADTGNLKQLGSISNRVFPVFLPPYAENFLNHSTGRCSNGRLIIDFLAFASLNMTNFFCHVVSLWDSNPISSNLDVLLLPMNLQTLRVTGY